MCGSRVRCVSQHRSPSKRSFGDNQSRLRNRIEWCLSQTLREEVVSHSRRFCEIRPCAGVRGSRGRSIALPTSRQKRRSSRRLLGDTHRPVRISLGLCSNREIEKHVVDPRTIVVKRWDAPLPESTAHAIRELWLTMLRQVGPEPCVNCISLDSSTEIFSARESDGRTRRAQLSIDPKRQTIDLVKIAFLLIDYCWTPVSERPEEARKIEKAALTLLSRVSGTRR